MNTPINHQEPNRQAARESYTGSRLTEARLDTAISIAEIIRRDIQKTASFINPLTDYANTFAGRDAVDASREERILRDIYTACYGESMNATRERLLEQEKIARETGTEDALTRARSIGPMIQDGDTMPYYLADDRVTYAMAQDYGIAETAARSMIHEAFERAEGKGLREHGKSLEEQHHRPVREAQRAARQADRQQWQRSGPRR